VFIVEYLYQIEDNQKMNRRAMQQDQAEERKNGHEQ
jgi:hypothetical protein